MVLKDILLMEVEKVLGEKPPLSLYIPKNKKYGDISSNFLIKFDDSVKEKILKIFRENRYFDKVDLLPPGFLNMHFSSKFYKDFVFDLFLKKEDYLRNFFSDKKKIQVEFVSANPTGPLTLGNGRNAVIGDTLANILSYVGYDVQKEYYLNDAGRKIELLKESVWARIMEIKGEDYDFPEDGYKGKYVYEIAERIIKEFNGKTFNKKEVGERALQIIIESIREDLSLFGVEFDNWFSEREMRERGEVEEVLSILKNKGLIYEKEGALWFKSSEFGDEKDRVLVKSSGDYTYTLTDIAYHVNKWKRGFDRVIDIWGWDHIGHVNPLKWALRPFGIPEDFLYVVLYHIVHLVEGGKEVKMSKTKGEFVTLRELVEDIGKDTVRFMFLARSPSAPLKFDLEIARKKSLENPVYYIQYAYTRTRAIERKRVERNIPFPDIKNVSFNFSGIEREIMNKIVIFEETLSSSARNYSPHLLPFFALELSKLFHSFYHDFPVLTEDDEVRNRRLVVVKSVEILLGLILRFMGVSTPERM